jgi:hypothetical protein
MALFEPTRDRIILAGQLIWFLAWLAVTAVALWLTPNPQGHGTHTQLGLPPCPSVLLFSKPCPGCGLTTSFSAFVHGDFPVAFRAHALGPALYLVFTGTALLAGFGWWRRRRLVTDSAGFNLSLAAFTLLFVAYSVFRIFTIRM